MGAASEKAARRRQSGTAQLRIPFLRNAQALRGEQAAGEAGTVEGRRGDARRSASAEDVLVTLPRGRYNELKASMECPARLIAPIQKGQAGRHLEGAARRQDPAGATAGRFERGAEGGFFKRMSDGVVLWFKGEPATAAHPRPMRRTADRVMNDLDDIQAERPEQGFQFPGVFEITAIGTCRCRSWNSACRKSSPDSA